MIVPHRGKKVYRFQMPIRFVKACAATVGVLTLVSLAGLFHYQYTVNQAKAELDELQTLRSVNMAQAGQLNQLAKNTAILQDEMSQLNQLDSEVRGPSGRTAFGRRRTGCSAECRRIEQFGQGLASQREGERRKPGQIA